jgi:hypothetical protein
MIHSILARMSASRLDESSLHQSGPFVSTRFDCHSFPAWRSRLNCSLISASDLVAYCSLIPP